MGKDIFSFKQFIINQNLCSMKVGTDGVLLGSWATGGCQILDVGTGTGLIAIMMAQRFKESEIDAIDIDDNAYIQAKANVLDSPFADRITIIKNSIQEFAKKEQHKYDSIVANPPFFVNSLKNPNESKRIARHTDTLSYEDLFRSVSILLSNDGEFNVIIPYDYLEFFIAEAHIFGFHISRRYDVTTKLGKIPKRCLMSFTKHKIGNMEHKNVVLNDDNNLRSEWFQSLTKDFYIK